VHSVEPDGRPQFTAHIVDVHENDGRINIVWFDHAGTMNTWGPVPIWQEGDPPMADEVSYCEWMPYQKAVSAGKIEPTLHAVKADKSERRAAHGDARGHEARRHRRAGSGLLHQEPPRLRGGPRADDRADGGLAQARAQVPTVRIEAPLVGVAQCPKCKTVGSLVTMGACCRIAAFVAMGSLWDVPPEQLKKIRTSTPFGRRRS
jgi:hypothetical protein